MTTQELLDPKSWAERTFGDVQLHDLRRTRRAVQAASRLAANPLGSLPAQLQTWKETKALYRLLDEPDVTFAALMQPHFQQTREQATSSPVVLLVQDTTDIDLSHRHKISGVGQIGNERGRGFFVQTVLAVRPQTRQVLGCMAQEPFVRIPAPEGEQRYQRRKRDERETDVWMRQVHAIGTPESASLWVHVGDRGADMFPFFQAWRSTQTHFLVRAAQNRRVQASEEEISYALTQARAFPSQASRPFEVPARHGRQARSTQSPLAVRLLQVRALAREEPERPAHEVIEPLMLAVLAQRSGHLPASMTAGTFWTEVARLGGYLARSHDGPPGWRTIWKGWLSLQTLLEGAHLAFHLRL